jgi:hypothetical protein
MPRLKARFIGPLSSLLLAALVFAPGDHRMGQNATTQMDSGEMAAWMLAPTLEQGLAVEERSGRVDASPQERGKRGIGRIWVDGPPLGAFRLMAASRSVLAIVTTTSRPEGSVDSSMSRRGPPLFQPV